MTRTHAGDTEGAEEEDETPPRRKQFKSQDVSPPKVARYVVEDLSGAKQSTRPPTRTSPQKERKVSAYTEQVKGTSLDAYFKEAGFQRSKAEFTKKESLKNDQYFLTMNEFIDDKLSIVAEKVGEKKTLQEIKKQNVQELAKIHNESQLLDAKNGKICDSLQLEMEENHLLNENVRKLKMKI